MSKIALITTLSHVPWGGSEQLWQKTALFAKKQGHEVLCVVYKWENENSKIKELKENNIRILYRDNRQTGNDNIFSKAHIYLKKKIVSQNFEFKELLEFDPDFVCISQGGTFDLGFNNQKKLADVIEKLNKPYIIICQNNADVGYVPDKIVREKMRILFQKAKKILFCSERNHRVAERQLTTIFTNVHYTSNPLTISNISIKPFPKNNVINFAEVASLRVSHKGQDILLEVLSSEKWKNRNWKLNLYGKGEDENYLKELTKFLGLENKVNFCGYISDMDKLWDENHIYLLPSLGEGLPITLCDAVLSGRTAVATDVGGNSELIIDNETGFLCPAPTVKLFDETLERAWQNQDKWHQFGENAFNLGISRIDISPEKTLLELIIK